jgi:hypothetical protein
MRLRILVSDVSWQGSEGFCKHNDILSVFKNKRIFPVQMNNHQHLKKPSYIYLLRQLVSEIYSGSITVRRFLHKFGSQASLKATHTLNCCCRNLRTRVNVLVQLNNYLYATESELLVDGNRVAYAVMNYTEYLDLRNALNISGSQSCPRSGFCYHRMMYHTVNDILEKVCAGNQPRLF